MLSFRFFYSLCLLYCFSTFTLAAAAAPRYLDPAFDEAHLPPPGIDTGVLFLSGDAQIAGFRNVDAVGPVRLVRAGEQTRSLPMALRDTTTLTYTVNGEYFGLADFMHDNHVGGVLVIKDGEVVLEQYGLGNEPETRWVSFSMTKSVVSLLVGAAIKDGYIGSVDDLITDYLPQLQGSSYDGVTIKHVLQMASGNEWNEDYTDPASDVASSPGDMLALMHYLGAKPRAAAPGKSFNYNTGETNLVGAILRAAIGNNLAAYLSQKIWQPWGMQADATWLAHGPQAGEWGGCCLSTTLRDWGRLALFVLNDGVLDDGSAVLPANWMRESTTPSLAAPHYGYLWWLEADARFRASGIFGQAIYFDPQQQLIMVLQGAWPQATGPAFAQRRDAFFDGVAEWVQ